VDAWGILEAMLGQAPLVAAAVAALYVVLSRRIDRMERRIEVRLGRLEERVDRLGWAFCAFSEALLETLSAKGVLSVSEARALAGYLKAIPHVTSRYYTEEVRRRLAEILKAVEEGSFTPGDVRELQRIAKLIEREAEEGGREDLVAYYYRLRMLIAVLKGVLRGQGRWPREWDREGV
jgi:phage tail tape-measure protein